MINSLTLNVYNGISRLGAGCVTYSKHTNSLQIISLICGKGNFPNNYLML